MRGDATDVENRPSMGLVCHIWRKDLAAEVSRKQASIDDFMPLIVGDLLVRNRRICPRTINEHIDLSKRGNSRVKQGLNAQSLVGGHGQKRRFSAEGLDCLHPFLS